MVSLVGPGLIGVILTYVAGIWLVSLTDSCIMYTQGKNVTS